MNINISAQNPLSVCYADVESAAKRLQGKVFKTPVLTSATFNNSLILRYFSSARTFSARVRFFKKGHLAPSTRDEFYCGTGKMPVHLSKKDEFACGTGILPVHQN